MKKISILFLILMLSSFCIKKKKIHYMGKYFDTKTCELVFDFPRDTLIEFIFGSNIIDIDSNKKFKYEYRVKDNNQKVYTIPPPSEYLKINSEFTLLLYTTERSSAVYYINITPEDWKYGKKVSARQERR